MCYNFLNFFCFFFFWNFLARVGWERNSRIKNFSLLLGLSHPGLDGHNARTMFFKLLNFFAFFLEFSSSGRVRMKFGTIIFFFLSRPISSGFVQKQCRRNDFFFNFLLFVWNLLAQFWQERNSGLNLFFSFSAISIRFGKK